MISGSIPALVTPFGPEGEVDEACFRELVEFQIAEGSTALVVCGTTGEHSTLTFAEQFRTVRICVEQTRGRVPVIAGAGSNDTRTAVENLRASKEAGADAALVVPPYYNRPSQEGVVAHFRELALNSAIPMLLYNVPSRTVTDILPETVQRIVAASPDTYIGIKNATGDLERVTQHRAGCGSDFIQLAGNDDSALPFNALGGVGCISVTANVAPRLCADFQQACSAGDFTEALRLHDLLYPLHRALFADASPAPAKYALSRVRRGFSERVRLPMVRASADARARVDLALASAGLLDL